MNKTELIRLAITVPITSGFVIIMLAIGECMIVLNAPVWSMIFVALPLAFYYLETIIYIWNLEL